MDRIKVKDNLSLERDINTGAVINNNVTDYELRKLQKRAVKNKNDEISEIKSELAEIKALLRELGGK